MKTRQNRDHTEPVFEVVDLDVMNPAEHDFAELFDANLIGQPEARQIALDVRTRYKNPARDMNRPLGVYWLAGKSRRGKSLLAQVLAFLFHGSRDALTRLTSEDFQDKSDMHGLRGAPPRYESWRKPVDAKKLSSEALAQVDEYSVITNWNRIRVRLSSNEEIDIVVLEEFGKSGEGFYKFWMEVFDKGKKVLANGEMADFRNTVFILTDNTGMDEVEREEAGGIGFNAQPRTLNHEEIVAIVDKHLIRKYKPEFRNRLDRIVVYRDLTADGVADILGVELRHFEERLMAQMPRGEDFTLEVTESARKFMLATAKDEVANLKKVIIDLMENPIGRLLSKDNENRVLGGDLVRVSYDANSVRGKNGKLDFAIARGAGITDQRLEGLDLYRGETDESMKGLGLQRRISKARMRANVKTAKQWTLVLTKENKRKFQEDSAALINDVRRVHEIEIESFSLREKAPFTITLAVTATEEQISLIKEHYPELVAKVVPQDEPKPTGGPDGAPKAAAKK
jgi:ATPases with chaperone activity, ATP-binding subunit